MVTKTKLVVLDGSAECQASSVTVYTGDVMVAIQSSGNPLVPFLDMDFLE